MKTAIVVLMLILPVAAADAQISYWTESATVKIRPSDLPNTTRSVNIKAARNEYESFQVAVQGTEALTITDISVTDLTQNSLTFSKDNIKIYREGYIEIVTPSNLEGSTGPWPDPLIPKKDVFFNETRNAFPVTVPAGRNQAFWFDIFIPLSTGSGTYTGELTVTAKDHPPIDIPLTLTVWGFRIPATSSLISAFGFDGWDFQLGHFGDLEHYDQTVPLSRLYAQAGLMNRLTLSSVTKEDWSILWPEPPNIDWTEFDANWGPFFDGMDLPFGPKNARFTSLETVNSGDTDPERIAFWQSFSSHFKENGWFHLLVNYTWDEPNDAGDFAEIKRISHLVHQADPELRTLVTTDIQQGETHDIVDDVDVWVPLINFMDNKPGETCWQSPYAGNQRDLYTPLITAGDELWWYQSCMSHGCDGSDSSSPCYTGWPSYMIDIPAIYNRIMEWESFKYAVSGELYFEVTWAYKGISGNKDAWNNQYYFGGNGDGTLFYPGRPDKIGGTRHIPVESIRLKMIREGMEDYEYMKKLKDLGETGFLDQQLATVVTNAHTFTHDPSLLYRVREGMAERIIAVNGQATLYVETEGICGGNQPCHATIQGAINMAKSGATIKIAGGRYPESITLDKEISLSLQGDWNTSFTQQKPQTTIFEGITVQAGTLTLQNLILRP